MRDGFEVVPRTVGPRGAVYDWQVVDASGTVLYDSAARVACIAFIEGIRWARGFVPTPG